MTVVFHMLIALLISALSGMGVGGGGLFTVYLSFFEGIPQLKAQGMNLLFFLFSAGAAVLAHIRKRKLLPMAILWMAAAGIVGALCGTALTPHVNGDLLRQIFGAMLVLCGILSLQKKSREGT